MDIVKLISDKTLELANNGKLNEIVEKHVTNCIDDVVQDCFKWSGEGKKAIRSSNRTNY